MFKLFTRIVLKNIREDRFLTGLSILGVALGVGLFIGVNTATRQSIASFEANIRSIDPAFNYEVVRVSGIDFGEEIYRDVRAVAEKSLPILTTNAYLGNQQQTLDIIGIYSTSALSVLNLQPDAGFDFEEFFSHLNSVLVSKAFSDEHNLRKGDVISALVYNKKYDLRIDGIVDQPSFPSGAILMDLGNYQEYFGKAGVLSRIDIIADQKEAAGIARILPAHLLFQKKEQVLRNRASLIDAFRLNLRFITFLAVLVGIFLLYNTIFISVVKRRTEIGILRGLGMGRATTTALFTVQGALLGLAGSLLGIVFGYVSARLATGLVGQTVSHFYGSPETEGSFITPADALRTAAFGLLVSLVASLIPALESANVRPTESSRAGTFEKAYKARQRTLSIIGIILVAAGGVLALLDYRFIPFQFPWLSHAGILLLIAGCTLNAPAYLGAVIAALKRPLSAMFKTAGRIAAGDMRGARYRFSLALMSVAVSSALIIAIVSSVDSLKSSFIDWINASISADVYIKPASCASNFCLHPLPDEIVETVTGLPGVESIGAYRTLQVDFNGSKIVAGFGNSELLWKYRPGISREEKERLQRLARFREVHISDYLAVRYGLKKGDTIELLTPRGKVGFVVNGSSISYSTMSGFVYLDRRWLREYWGLDDATHLSVHLKEGQDARAFMNQIREKAGRYALDITDNNQLRRSAIEIFDRSFAITYTIELIAIVISLIGVVNALLILVLEKKREISILLYLGATKRHIGQVMALSAGILAATGIALGSVMGAAIGIVITHVINKISFGWEVSFRIPFSKAALLMALLFIISLLAAIIPYSLSRKIDPKVHISFE